MDIMKLSGSKSDCLFLEGAKPVISICAKLNRNPCGHVRNLLSLRSGSSAVRRSLSIPSRPVSCIMISSRSCQTNSEPERTRRAFWGLELWLSSHKGGACKTRKGSRGDGMLAVELKYGKGGSRLHASASVGGGSDLKMGSSKKEESIQLYGQIERVFSESARRAQGNNSGSGRWEEIEGAWVLRPSSTPAVSVVHFIGGAFVGASPQLTYRLFLERLADRGVIIVATPYACGFDHLRIADEAEFKFGRCVRYLCVNDQSIEDLPVFGVGHSMGALAHLLIGARYAVQRKGNVLISFNNKEASRAIPLFSPVILPAAQNVGPILSSLMMNPTLRFGADMAMKQLQENPSPLVKQILPLLQQLPPLYRDLADGRDEFTPTPDDTTRLLKSYYGVKRNLLIRFKDDSIDETPSLADLLSSGSSISDNLDLSIRTLHGDHARPLQQVIPEIPPAVAEAVTQGGAFIASFAAGTPLADFARGVEQTFGPESQGQKLQQKIVEDIEDIIDEMAPWMEIPSRSSSSVKYFPKGS